jgi:hypothetical protein
MLKSTAHMDALGVRQINAIVGAPVLATVAGGGGLFRLVLRFVLRCPLHPAYTDRHFRPSTERASLGNAQHIRQRCCCNVRRCLAGFSAPSKKIYSPMTPL